MNEFKVNDLISLRYRYRTTEIYVNGNYFMQCKRLILNIPKSDFKRFNSIDSIDEAVEVYEHNIRDHEIFKGDGVPEVENDENFSLIRPEEEFWGHCSNLQVWSEHDYDTRLLKANLAFPLLEKLAEAGDKLAQIKLKEEILKRFLSGSESVVEYLFVESYQDCLSNEELLTGLLEPKEADLLMEIQQKLNVVFKFVPTIDRDIEFNPPINTKEIERIRKFSIENKCVNGLELKYSDTSKELSTYLNKLKNLRELRFSGGISGREDEPERSIKMFSNLVKKFLIARGLAVNLSVPCLETMNDLGIEIYSSETTTKITPDLVKNYLAEKKKYLL